MTDRDYERIRARHPNIPQDPLFEMPTVAPSKRSRKRATVRTVRTAVCPRCWRSNAKVSVIRTTGGLEIFRDHDKFTTGGRRIPCSGSGTEAPPDPNRSDQR